jgi:hypothetical protein
MEQLWQDSHDMTSATTLKRLIQTDLSGQVGLTGQPGQLRQDRTERMGCQEIATRTGQSCVHEQWRRTAGTGQVGQDR